MTFSREQITAAAEGIANARFMRGGSPPFVNPLDMLPTHLREQVIEEAEEALKAVSASHASPGVPEPAAPLRSAPMDLLIAARNVAMRAGSLHTKRTTLRQVDLPAAVVPPGDMQQLLEAVRRAEKAPSIPAVQFAALTTQDQINVGLNGFAVTLLAESFAHRRADFGDGALLVRGWGKDKKAVFMTLSSEPPILPPTDEDATICEDAPI